LEFLSNIQNILADDQCLPNHVDGFMNIFSERTGIVVSSCHGLKGEEFEVVIAFGLLNGYIPHWDLVIASKDAAKISAGRLLYVIGSRAKNRLHLIAERGRVTKRNNPYQTTPLLQDIIFEYNK
jgi:superfamily I DNA/RNA helicase